MVHGQPFVGTQKQHRASRWEGKDMSSVPNHSLESSILQGSEPIVDAGHHRQKTSRWRVRSSVHRGSHHR